jgi:hypothetical protein
MVLPSLWDTPSGGEGGVNLMSSSLVLEIGVIDIFCFPKRKMEWNSKSENEKRLEVIKIQSVGMKKQLKDMHRQCRDLEVRIEELDVIILYRVKQMQNV